MDSIDEKPVWKDDALKDKDSDFKAALHFFLKTYNTPDIDEEEFVKHFKTFKEKTGNKSKHSLNRKKVSISKSLQLLRPPKTLCIHLNRLTYDMNGRVILNRDFVKFPEFLELSKDICPFDIDLKYRLAGVI